MHVQETYSPKAERVPPVILNEPDSWTLVHRSAEGIELKAKAASENVKIQTKIAADLKI